MAGWQDIVSGMNQPALPRIVIVADDLTSATDGAAPLVPTGYAPLIAQRDPRPWQLDMAAIDTNSRALTVIVELAR